MAQPGAATLRDGIAGQVVLPGDPDWDAARSGFNLALDQRPEAIVFPESEEDVAAAVRLAAERGLRIAPQGSGHGAGSLGPLAGAILLRTDRLTGVSVDPAAPSARARAGAKWSDVTALADEHALAALAGTAPGVNVVGYTLGGGIGWLCRRHGLAANSVRAADVVTADGNAVRVDAQSHPDLFWALRGGGGSFGVVTALEFALYPAPEIYAGVLFWPFERAAEVLHAWREWLPSVPEAVTSVGRLLQFPPIPELPEFLRGQAFAVVEAALLGPDAVGEELLRPLRDLEPQMDTFATIPPGGLGALHMDPPEPVPYAGDGGLLADLPAEAVDALLAATGPGSGSPLLTVEVRHLGGALGRAEPGHGALAAIEAPFAHFAAGFTPSPEAAQAVGDRLAAIRGTLAPWDSGRSYMNFAERPVDGARLFGEETLGRLREVRATYDPGGLFLANHPVTSA